MIRTNWFNIYVSPKSKFSDPEFRNDAITSLCDEYDVTFDPRPARRHNKIVQRILSGDKHCRQNRGSYKSDYEILSKATFVKNIIHGNKSGSSFELSHGYTPKMYVFPLASLSSDLTQAHL